MKCPKCGTTNGKTNKFCRECGGSLEGVTASVDQQTNGSICAPEGLAPGDELFDVWQLYSAGDLDAAQAKTERLISCNPDSAAAHNILGLIYERNAEIELAADNSDRREVLLKLAIAQYERIIDLNPDSVADRQKLELLRLSLAGQRAYAPRPTGPAASATWFAAIPRPWLAAGGAFIVCLIIGILVLAGGRDGTENPALNSQPAQQSMKVQTLSTPGATEEAPPAGTQSATNPPVYGFPQANPPTPTLPTVPPPPAAKPRTQVEPAKLPPLGELGVKVVPESKPGNTSAKKPGATNPSPAANTGRETIVINPVTPTPAADNSAQTPDGSSTLARAIDLHNQGRTQEAVAAAEQAIDLYQAEANAGRNASLAKRGMENARKMIRIWQQ